ncbi:teichoic acid transport system permease protein [Mobilisporobacter senegalensis]|uniref:Transport permease protein n=1 Tax=Mobilisporobacter senegalensis TaxID=1329262 RepID=A0A3N1XXX6_9FIRM|nr:ABC transporter permease [Mobilisporobacter senegalensis]ROR31473.1 teichoic acid transport system permease protein [Mobilisporobacter senegalensis]
MKSIVKIFMTALCLITINYLIYTSVDINIGEQVTFSFTAFSDERNIYQVFYSKNGLWNERESSHSEYTYVKNEQTLDFIIPSNTSQLRLDVGDKITSIKLSDFKMKLLWKTIKVNVNSGNESSNYNIENIQQVNNIINVTTNGNDPYFTLELDQNDYNRLLSNLQIINILLKLAMCILISSLILIVIKKFYYIKSIIYSIFNSRILIWNLAKNDFKTKYAGSYLGITWAFVQPIVIVLLYWFVFQVGFKSSPLDNFPFILWLVAGIVPWFYFQEAITNAMNSMLEYSYLVKKVVFKISILPVVKVISALFVHVFFVLFAIGIYSIYGYYPNIYTLQLIYYSFCMAILVLGISYITSSVIVFFKDLGQIVGILLQIGMWITPILWSYTMLPVKYQWLLKINPLYYITEGYRDSLIRNVWFWEKTNLTIYFWVVTLCLFGIGMIIFRKLKVHFADVL